MNIVHVGEEEKERKPKVGNIYRRNGGMFKGHLFLLSQCGGKYYLIDIGDGQPWNDSKEKYIEDAFGSSGICSFDLITERVVVLPCAS